MFANWAGCSVHLHPHNPEDLQEEEIEARGDEQLPQVTPPVWAGLGVCSGTAAPRAPSDSQHEGFYLFKSQNMPVDLPGGPGQPDQLALRRLWVSPRGATFPQALVALEASLSASQQPCLPAVVPGLLRGHGADFHLRLTS